MSVNLFKCIAKTLRHSVVLPQLSKVPTRHYVTLMDTATENTKDTSADVSSEKEEVLRNKNSTRYKRRWFERKWEDPKPRNTENGESEEKKIKSEDRIKRKKMAMLLGYCGANYYGMQRNPGVQTIEEELLKALWEAKYITEDDFNNQQNAQFQRSSRTDKGVSAARQVVSLKLPLETDIEEINKRLPDCIRVFAVKRVTNKFNSKVKCNARTYSYTLPTYAFAPEVASDEDRTSYRIPEHTLDKIKEVLAFYKGTKCYHNFTEKKYFNDPSASRYMMSFTVDRVFEHSGMQFAVLLVKGQSFMLHQIRKMVGLAIAVVRGHTGMDTMERVFGREKVMLPTAPGLGLVLDMVHYDRYADKHKESHDSLTWEGTEEAVQRFKEEHIYPYIVRGEIDDGSMHLWLTEKLSNHNYEPSEDSNNDKETTNAEKETENDEKETKNDEKETSAEKETKCLDSESVGDGADKCKNTDASNSSDSK